MSFWEKLFNFLKRLIEVNLPEEEFPEVPPEEDEKLVHLAVVVGHTKKKGGAYFAGHEFKNEYEYNSLLAENMKDNAKEFGIKVDVLFRDGIGIPGAYERVRALKPDCCIELHFNAYNGSVRGTETLCTPDINDKRFANIVQEEMCSVFKREGMSRGVKPISRSARGGGNVHGAPGIANCLVEPFFGDNKKECELAVSEFGKYSRGLLNACRKWFNS